MEQQEHTPQEEKRTSQEFLFSKTVDLLKPLTISGRFKEFVVELFDGEASSITMIDRTFDQMIEIHRIIANDNKMRQRFNQVCRKFHIFRSEPSANSKPQTRLIGHDMPSQPSVVLEPKPFRQLLELLLMDYTNETIQITSDGRKMRQTAEKGVMTWGMGGMGKTLLAAEVVRDLQAGSTFKVICWINMGIPPTDNQTSLEKWQEEHLQKSFVNLANQTTTTQKMSPTELIETLEGALDSIFGDQPSLVVLDDVWAPIKFPTQKPNIRFLITTRKQDLKINGKNTQHKIKLEALDFAASTELVVRVAELDPQETTGVDCRNEVIKKCCGLPLALNLVASYARSLKEDLSPEEMWKTISEQFVDTIDTSSKDDDPSKTNSTVSACIKMTMEHGLNQVESARFKDFVIFPEDVWIHQDVFLLLWKPELPQTAPGRHDSVISVLGSLVNFSLVERRTEESHHFYRAHDLVLMYLRSLLLKEDQQEVHLRLVDKYTSQLKHPNHLWSGPLDPGCYLIDHLEHHFQQAGKPEQASQCYSARMEAPPVEKALTVKPADLKRTANSLDWMLAQHSKPKTTQPTQMFLLKYEIYMLCAIYGITNAVFWRLILHRDENPLVWEYPFRFWMPSRGYKEPSCAKDLIATFWEIAATSPQLVDAVLADKLDFENGNSYYPQKHAEDFKKYLEKVVSTLG